MTGRREGLRVGLAGTGGDRSAHLAALRDLGADVVILDDATGSSFEDRLERVGVVDVVGPSGSDPSGSDPTGFGTAAALGAGRHVIAAVPFAPSVPAAEALAALAADRGLRLLPVLPGRSAPAVGLLHRAAADGELGRLAVLRFARSGPMPVPVAAGPLGGVLGGAVAGDLDAARWIAGEVVRVSAVRRLASGTEAVHVLATHESGAISQCSGLWGPAHLRPAAEYSVTGDGGTLAHSSLTERSTRADLEAPSEPDPAESALGPALRALLAAVADGGPAVVHAEDGLALQRITAAAAESIRTGQPAPVRPATEGGR